MTRFRKALFFIISINISASAFASSGEIKQIDNMQAAKMQLVNKGTVSLSGITGGPEDALKAIEKKASESGGQYFRLISLDTPGDSSLWRVSAVLY